MQKVIAMQGKKELPDNWQLTKLSNICTQITDGVHLTPKYQPTGIPFISVNNLSSGKLDFTDCKYISLDLHKELTKRCCPKKGDVVLSKVGTLGIADVIDVDFEFSIFVQLALLKPNTSKVNSNYLKYVLNSNQLQKEINSHASGTTLRYIGINKISNLTIPVPVLKEQQKIASILSKVDELIQKTDKNIEQTHRLKKGLMERLLTKGIGHNKFKDTKVGEIPIEWKISRLEELGKIERGKFAHRPRDDPDYYGGKYPFIQTGDVVKSKRYIRTYSQTLNERGLSVSRIFPPGIIALTIAANIGSTAITTFPVCFPDSVVGISTKDMNIDFLEHYLKTRKSFLGNKATVSAQHNINLETLRPLLIPVPPLAEQNDIAAILSSIDAYSEMESNEKSKLQMLKKGLMQKLLTGKIRVKV